MTHLRIELNNIQENVSSAVIEKLYELATSGDLDASSNLAGNIHTTATYLEYIDALHTAYPDLTISATDIYIMFEDPEVLNVLLANSIGDGVGVTLALAANANLGNMFFQNTAITSFNNFDKFTYANTHEISFKQCTNLRSINLSNCLVLGQLMFCGCTSLESANIGGPVTNVFIGVFQGCSNLQSLTFPSTLTLLSESFCNGCSKISTLDLSHILSLGAYAVAGTKITTADLSSCTSIGHEAFSGCTSLQSVTLSSQLTSIPMGTFKGCSSLSSIDLSHITSIGGVANYGAFQGCSSLTNVTLNSAITSIPLYCFHQCSSLASISGLSNITEVGLTAFSGCTSLTTTDIDWTKITNLGDSAFNNCKLTGTLNLSSLNMVDNGYGIGWNIFKGNNITSVTSLGTMSCVGRGMFLDCHNLTSVTLPSTCKKIWLYAFMGCNNLSSITLDYIEELTSNALDGCTSLTGTLTFPSLKRIGTSSFNTIGASKLILPVIEYIGPLSFYSSVGPSTVDFGSTLTSIDVQAFWGGCIYNFIFRSTTVPTFVDNGVRDFCFTMTGRKIYVPDAVVNDYKTTWTSMASYIYPLSDYTSS